MTIHLSYYAREKIDILQRTERGEAAERLLLLRFVVLHEFIKAFAVGSVEDSFEQHTTFLRGEMDDRVVGNRLDGEILLASIVIDRTS